VLDPWVALLEEHGVAWLQQPELDRQAHFAKLERSTPNGGGLSTPRPRGPGVP
jgi:hypothetical protein